MHINTKTYENEAVNAMQDMAAATESASKSHKDFNEAAEAVSRKGNKRYYSQQHPLHGHLKRIVKIKMPDGSIKPMKVKYAYRNGYLKTK